jgi:hypothetical protein
MQRSPASISTSKFFTAEEIKLLKLHDDCRVPNSATRWVMFHQLGLLFSCQQPHFLKEDKTSCNLVQHVKETSAEKLLFELDSISDLFYIAMIDDPKTGLYSIRSKGHPSATDNMLVIPEGDNYVTYLRKALSINNNAKVLLGIAWTTGKALQYATAYPERLIVDTTYKNNVEKRALFLASGITSCNNAFIALCIFTL